tara:strand:- start:2290 stop:3708 length:1419 start_codon:yes stop_codon:yes gene_type:complete
MNKLPKLKKISDKKKKKILLLSDDLRMFSGVANMSREIVLGTIDEYDWCQIGGAVKHPEQGKIIDMNEGLKSDGRNFKNPYLKIYPVTGYGSPDFLREVLKIEKPDAIMHFTDPRQWIWLYQMERELRNDIPILYYNIWDDLPDPRYNTHYYRSSDVLISISKQTYGINKRLLDEYNYEDWQFKYIPHGINSHDFNQIEKGDTLFKRFEEMVGIDKYKFKILYVNRNIRRKNPGDCVLAYKYFMDKLTPEQRKECVFIFHAAPKDENGTDVREVHKAMCPEYPIIFTHDIKNQTFNVDYVNKLYNSADVYMNLASNEGFGLGSCEALSVGTPIIVNVTGGLQDQCGFKNNKGEYLTADDYIEIGSNHRGQYKEHGEWVKPVFPSNISLQGSPLTPYIYDDRCMPEDAAEALKYWYDKTPEEREICGKKGIEFVKDSNIGMDSKEMSKRFIECINTTFKEWKPRKKFEIMEVV